MARPLTRSQVRARPAAEEGTDRMEGRRTGGGTEPRLLEGFGVFERGFSQEFAWPASGAARWRSPPPLLAEQVAGSSGFLGGPAPWPPALRPPRHAGLSRLLRKGKARAPAGAGWSVSVPWESRCSGGGSQSAQAGPIIPAGRAGGRRDSCRGGRHPRLSRGFWEPAGY